MSEPVSSPTSARPDETDRSAMRSATSDKRWEPTRLEKLTECSVYMTPEGPRIWCEADLAGPCQGCPEANRG